VQSIKVGCEGLMVKRLCENSSYEPSRRSFKWLKLKKDYIDTGLGDSFDLVPIAAFFGSGKRKGLYGAYLLACYNQDFECYETICKVATGFSDEQLDSFYKEFLEHVIPEPLKEYKTSGFKADVWFEPFKVWEIKGADMQISPVYTAAIGQADKARGIGLRFPRILKTREDKSPTEATSSKQIHEIYKNQAVISNNNKLEDDDDDDFY